LTSSHQRAYKQEASEEDENIKYLTNSFEDDGWNA
jgi:hypothetical protein